MKKTLKQIMEEGWEEKFVYGFGRGCVVYRKEDRQMNYDEINEFVIAEYHAPERKE